MLYFRHLPSDQASIILVARTEYRYPTLMRRYKIYGFCTALALSLAGLWFALQGQKLADLTDLLGLNERMSDRCYSGEIRYCIVGQDEDGMIKMPRPTDYWTAENKLDKEGLPLRQGNHGRYRNVSSVAFALYGSRLFDLENACRTFTETDVSRAAEKWLLENFVGLKNGSVVWHYDYDSQMNDVMMYAPYGSAFSQAAIIERLLLLNCAKKDNFYLEVARRAARAFDVPILEGGLRTSNPDFVWFQESPLPDEHNPFVLNAHLYTIYVLNLLHPYFPNDGFDRLAERGLEALKKVLPVIDTGYWNRYDLRPAYTNFFLAIPKTEAILRKLTLHIGDKSSNIDFRTGAETPAGNVYKGKHDSLPGRKGITLRSRLLVRLILPAGREFDWTLTQHSMTLAVRIECCGKPLELLTAGLRPGITELYSLEMQSRTRDGDDEVLTFKTGLRDSSWWQVAPEYIPYHAALMAHLTFQTQHKDLYIYALRWEGFSRRYREDKMHKDDPDNAPVRQRYAFDPDPELGPKLLERFGTRVPEEISERELEEAIEAIYPLSASLRCDSDSEDPACHARRKARATLAMRPAN